MSMGAASMPQDPKAAFKAEWEALEIAQHQFALANVDAELLRTAENALAMSC